MRTSVIRVVLLAVNTVLVGLIVGFVVLVGVALVEKPPALRKPHDGFHEVATELRRGIVPELEVLSEMAGREKYSREDFDRFNKARASLRAKLEKSENDYDPFWVEKFNARFPNGTGRMPQRRSVAH